MLQLSFCMSEDLC